MTNKTFSNIFWPAIAVLAILWIVCFVKARAFEEKRQADKIKAISDIYEKMVR